MSTATDKAFNNVELLKHILLLVERPAVVWVSDRKTWFSSKEEQTFPAFAQLFSLQRVGQAFRDVIRGSTKLQQRMCLIYDRSDSDVLQNSTLEVDRGRDFLGSQLRTADDPLDHPWNLLVSGSSQFPHVEPLLGAFKLSINFHAGCTEAELASIRAPDRSLVTDERHTILAKALKASTSTESVYDSAILDEDASWRAIPISRPLQRICVYTRIRTLVYSENVECKEWAAYGVVLRPRNVHNLGGLFELVEGITTRSAAEHHEAGKAYQDASNTLNQDARGRIRPFPDSTFCAMVEKHGGCQVHECRREVCTFCWVLLECGVDYVKQIYGIS